MRKKNSVVNQAIQSCNQEKERLTKPRIEVLKIIAASNQPLGAYKILKQLGKVIKEPHPPTVYRAIDFWLQKGFIHRIECLNAYVVCRAGHKHQGGQFMICDDCGAVIEAHICELPQTFKDTAKQKTFLPSSWNLSIHGTCLQCQGT